MLRLKVQLDRPGPTADPKAEGQIVIGLVDELVSLTVELEDGRIELRMEPSMAREVARLINAHIDAAQFLEADRAQRNASQN